jgi:hypothetical protein
MTGIWRILPIAEAAPNDGNPSMPAVRPDLESRAMPTEQLLLHLPDDLVRRFKRSIPSRRRSAFVQQLLEQALPPDRGDDDPLYQAALVVEQDLRRVGEMAEWEAATIGDGLPVAPSRKRRR